MSKPNAAAHDTSAATLLAEQTAEVLSVADKLRTLGRSVPDSPLIRTANPADEPYPDWHEVIAASLRRARADVEELQRIIARVEV